MRKPIIAGNWKMHKTTKEAKELMVALKEKVCGLEKTTLPEIVVAPTFTSLQTVSDLIECDCIKLGAQNCYYEPCW